MIFNKLNKNHYYYSNNNNIKDFVNFIYSAEILIILLICLFYK
uniref:Uncharacterized protein n=1 Tax=viral metagenome TaxID=1070528 RepID=A0A6C0H7G0_9ZZZZ